MIELADGSIVLRDSLVLTLENGICQSIGEDGTLDAIDSTIEDVILILNDIGSFEKDEMILLKEMLEETFSNTEAQVLGSLESAESYERWLPAYTVPMLVMGCLLVLGATLSWFMPTVNKWFFILQTWVTLPLLILTVIGSVLIASGLGPVLIANSGKESRKEFPVLNWLILIFPHQNV